MYGIGGESGDGVLDQGLVLIVGECTGERVTVEVIEVLKEEERETVEVVGLSGPTRYVFFVRVEVPHSGYGHLWWFHYPCPTRDWVFELGALPSLYSGHGRHYVRNDVVDESH